jgi:hypothetical protein
LGRRRDDGLHAPQQRARDTDLSFHKALPIDQIREYHDYAFDIARATAT